MPAIGIFDSGIGGLTVFRALKQALPGESFVYLGDTARLPYGSKSPETIRRYLTQNLRFLKDQHIKAVVVACNSASTVLEEGTWENMPIYGVIRPGARAALACTKGHVGILGTRATVTSRAYVHAIHELHEDIRVDQQACPLLVPLVEEGWHGDPITRQILERYLEPLLASGVDTLVLGCTHYPVLKSMIAEIVGPTIQLVDSAEAIAAMLHDDLTQGRIPATARPRSLVYTTDINPAFCEVGNQILAPFTVDEWCQADLK